MSGYATTCFGLGQRKDGIARAPELERAYFSHLRKTRAPTSRSRLAQVSTGVRCAYGRMRAAAWQISLIVGAVMGISY